MAGLAEALRGSDKHRFAASAQGAKG